MFINYLFYIEDELIEEMKEFTREKMTIDLAIWPKGYSVPMNELYTDLSLEKIDSKPTGSKTEELDDYKELFIGQGDQKRRKAKGNKILVKADLGFGKTTLSKKIAYDWATGVFKVMSLVFCISLKLVWPGETIENIIIDQYPVLEGLGIGPGKLKQVLESFGNRCLIVLDGNEKCDLQSNEDIQKIIEGRKLLHCNVLITSRPHCISDVVADFKTTVSVKGFTKAGTIEFISRILNDKDEIERVFNFNWDILTQKGSLHSCPMLLLFMCILVNSKEISLQDNITSLGEICLKLVRCLYRKFVISKSSKFKESEVSYLLKQMGKVAWDTLQSGLNWFKSDDIGEDIINYGLLSGKKSHDTTHVFISFPNRILQEFLGALYFILKLNEGNSIKESLHPDSPRPIFMMNPMILYFCLFFLCEKQNHFIVQKEKIYTTLVNFISKRIDTVQIDLDYLKDVCPALVLLNDKDKELGFNFLNDVFALCRKTTDFQASYKFYPYCVMPNLRVMTLVEESVSTGRHLFFITAKMMMMMMSDDEFSVLLSCDLPEQLDSLLAFCKKPSLYALPRAERTNICEFVKGNVKKVTAYNDSSSNQTLTADSAIDSCPFLTHLCLMQLVIDESVLVALANAIKLDKLAALSHLSFEECHSSLKGKLSLLFESKWALLTHLSFKGSHLDACDIGTLTVGLVNHKAQKFPMLSSLVLDLGDESGPMENMANPDFCAALYAMSMSPLENMNALCLYNSSEEFYQNFILCLNQGNLPNLTEFSMSFLERNKSGKKKAFSLFPVMVPTLTDLTLPRFIHSPELLHITARSATYSRLHKLDISHSSGIAGNLSILLRHNLSSLTSLILSDCGLNSQDLCSLAKASVEARLPQLTHLDISDNERVSGQLQNLFAKNCKWDKLRSFIIGKIKAKHKRDLQLLARDITSGCLRSIKRLAIFNLHAERLFKSIGTSLPHLERVVLVCHPEHIRETLESISVAVEKDLLPSLDRITILLTMLSESLDNIVSQIRKLVQSSSAMADSAVGSLWVKLKQEYPKCNLEVECFLDSLDQPTRDILMDKVQNRRLNMLSKALTDSLVENLDSKSGSKRASVTRRVLSQIEVQYDEDLESALLCTFDTLLRNIRDVLPTDITKDRSRAAKFIASLDPPVTQRILGVFPDVDPELLDSASNQLSEKLIDILPELPIYSINGIVILLERLVVQKIASLTGEPSTEQLESLVHSVVSGSDSDSQAAAQKWLSSLATDVIRKLRKNGIRIYFEHHLDSEIIGDQLNIIEKQVVQPDEIGTAASGAFWSDTEKMFDSVKNMVSSMFVSIRQKLLIRCPVDSSKASELITSIDPPIRNRVSGVLPGVGNYLLEVIAQSIKTSLGDLLVSDADSAAYKRYILLHLEEPHDEDWLQFKSGVAHATSWLKQALGEQLSADVPLSSLLPKALQSVSIMFSDKIDSATLDRIAQSLVVLVEYWSSETGQESYLQFDPERDSWSRHFLSQINVLSDKEFLCDKLESVVNSIVAEIAMCQRDQLLAVMAENPSLAAEVVASLDPPIADRISKVFPGADLNELESARKKFIDNLVEILPDLRNSDHDDSLMKGSRYYWGH